MRAQRNHETLINRDISEMISRIPGKLRPHFSMLLSKANEMEQAYPEVKDAEGNVVYEAEDWDFMRHWIKKNLEFFMSVDGRRATELIQGMEADAGTRAMAKLNAMIKTEYEPPTEK